MNKVLVINVPNQVLEPDMVSAEAKAIYVRKHHIPFPADKNELARARHHKGLVKTAQKLGQLRFLSWKYHFLCDPNDHEVGEGTVPLAIAHVDDYHVDFVGTDEYLIDKNRTLWVDSSEQPYKSTGSPLLTVEQAKMMSPLELACVVAHSSHIISRLNAFGVLAGMSDRASDAEKYSELEKVTREMRGEHCHYALLNAYTAAGSRKKARLGASADGPED